MNAATKLIPLADTATALIDQSVYADDKNRFIVALVVGYGVEDGITNADEAAEAALSLTRDEGSSDTQWVVFDRVTGAMEVLEQSEFFCAWD